MAFLFALPHKPRVITLGLKMPRDDHVVFESLQERSKAVLGALKEF
jgi:hypothetical protein